MVGWRLDGNLVEAARRLHAELADESIPNSPATVNVSNTTMLVGQEVGDDDTSQHMASSCDGNAGPPDCNDIGSPLDTEGISDDDFQQGSLRPVMSVNKYGSSAMHSISPAPAPPLESPIDTTLDATPSAIVPAECHASKLQGKHFLKRKQCTSYVQEINFLDGNKGVRVQRAPSGFKSYLILCRCEGCR